MNTIAITGATGQLGSLIVNNLKQRVAPESILALVRDVKRAEALGVPARVFDYSKPETLATALNGVHTLMLVSSNEIGQRTAQHRNVIAAAKAAGVKHIIYTSLLRATTSPIVALAGEHIETENALVESGIGHTILRNGWYTENYTASIPGSVQAGAFVGAAGDARISSAARADYAEAAAIVLANTSLQGKTYELAGDVAYTLTELAAEISRQIGKQIPYNNLTEAGYAEVLTKIGLPAPVAAAYASFDTGAAAGGLYEAGHVLSELLGHPTTTLAASVAAALKA